MATTLSSDIYNLSTYVLDIQNKFTDLEEETLALGTYGYQGEIYREMLQNSIIMASEYSNESIPIKAKFEENILMHALSLGIDKINATPASISVMLSFPEEYLLNNMSNDKFIFDKDISIFIGDYEFHTDYNIIITKNKISTGESVYTAMYDVDIKNPISTITSPYLPSVIVIKVTNDLNLVIVQCTIRQVELFKTYTNILSDNPMSNKVITFEFENQLAAFYVSVKEGDTTHYLTPYYSGLCSEDDDEVYCNYSYINSNNIRVVFDRNSYEPTINCEVTVVAYLTKGEEGNFTYNQDIETPLESDNIDYNGMYMIVKPISDSDYGVNRKTVDEIKAIIPKEALSRGSITNSTDLGNFFNSIDTEKCKLYFYKKKDNQNERLYYAYLLIKDDDVIIPTNTIDIAVEQSQFDVITETSLILKPGKRFFYKKNDYGRIIDTTDLPLLADYAENGFSYITPFLCIVNRDSLYMTYYLNIFNKNKFLDFTYVNSNSKIQFISSNINWKREYFTDSDKYKLSIDLIQNIDTDVEDLIVYNADKTIIQECKVRVFALLYNKDDTPYRYIELDFKSFNNEDFIYSFQASLDTDDDINSANQIRISNCKDIASDNVSYGYFNQDIDVKFYVLAKFSDKYGRDDTDKFIPALEEYTLCNKYDINTGISFYYNYSNIINSPVSVEQIGVDGVQFNIKRIPMIGHDYVYNEKKIQSFIKEVEKRREYIDFSMDIIEDSFGIDFKFFNTYGPSTLFQIQEGVEIDRLNLSLTFKAKPITTGDKYIKNNIAQDVKEYIENINEITDLHIPNLITKITNTYGEQLVYFEFVSINDYGPGYQHIYKPDVDLKNRVPEFLNIATNKEGLPDIIVEML